MPSDEFGFLERTWAFLRDEENRAVLAFLGAGAAAIIVAGWTVYTHRSAKKSDNATTSVKIGLDEAKTAELVADAHRPLTEKLEKISDQIAEQKGIPAAPLHAVLEKLGEKGVPDHEIPAKLDAAADQLIEFRQQLAKRSNDRPELAAIREQVLALIDQGDLDAARIKLNEGRGAAHALREEASRNEAEFLADEAGIDNLQLDYRAAADKYAAAAQLVAPFDRKAEWRFLILQAGVFHDLGKTLPLFQALVSRA